MKYFWAEKSPINDKYIVKADMEKIGINKFEGSLNVLPARLLGLTYANYLRICRDVFGAELVGKNCIYVVPYFNQTEELYRLIEILNSAMKGALIAKNGKAPESFLKAAADEGENFNYITWARNNPDELPPWDLNE